MSLLRWKLSPGPAAHTLGLSLPNPEVRWALILLVLGACQSDVRVPLPEVPENIAWVALRFDHDARLAPRYTTLERNDPVVAFEVSPENLEGATRVELLGYTSDQIRLVDPPLERLDEPLLPPDGSRANLPRPAMAVWAPWRGDATRFTEDADPEPVTAPWMPVCPTSACDSISVISTSEISLPGDVRTVFTAWPTGYPLVVTGSGASFEVRDGRLVRSARTSTTTPILAAASSPEHGFWVLTPESLCQITPDGWVPVVEVSGLAEAKLAVSPSGDLEVLIASAARGLLAYQGETVRPIETGLDPPNAHDVTWMGPGRAAAAFPDTDAVVFLDGDEVRVDRSLPGPLSLEWTKQFGLVVGTRPQLELPSGLYQYGPDGTWVRIEGIPTMGVVMREIWSSEYGVFFGGFQGALFYQLPGLRACSLDGIVTSATLSDLTFEGERLYLSTLDRPGLEAPLIQVDVTFRPPHPGCRSYEL